MELLLSTSLGVLLLGSAVAVLLAAGRMRRNQQLLSDANDEARVALRLVSRTLAATGVGGGTYRYMGAGNVPQRRSAILFTDGTATNKPKDAMPQTPDTLTVMRYGADRRGELVAPLAGSPVRLTPDPRPATSKGVDPLLFHEGESALVTNFQRALLLPVNKKMLNLGTNTVDLDMGSLDPARLQDPSVRIDPGASVFPVQLVRYRVIPMGAKGTRPERRDLLAETLDPSTLKVLQETVVARDVEDFQVQWASDNNDDGVADGPYGDMGPSETFIDPALTFARVSISVRTSGVLMSGMGELVAKGEKTPFELGLDLGNTPQPESSGYRRRVLSTVVLLKNLTAPRI